MWNILNLLGEYKNDNDTDSETKIILRYNDRVLRKSFHRTSGEEKNYTGHNQKHKNKQRIYFPGDHFIDSPAI